jgi:hypothetical protein
MTSVVRAADPPSVQHSAPASRYDHIDSMEDEEAISIMVTLQRSLNEDILLLTLIKIKENLGNSELKPATTVYIPYLKLSWRICRENL